MKMFEYLLITLLPFIVTFIANYVIGSFIGTSFNPADWTMDLRVFMAFMGTVWGLALWINFYLKGFYDGYY